jgi:hypothetical protein
LPGAIEHLLGQRFAQLDRFGQIFDGSAVQHPFDQGDQLLVEAAVMALGADLDLVVQLIG